MVVYYRKIPKIVQRPFWRGLYLEVVIFGGAYLRREICVSKSIELALQLEVNLPFLLRFTLYLRASFHVQRIFCVTGLEGFISGILGYIID